MRGLSIVVVALVACHHGGTDSGPVSARWRGPALLAPVPADTPYVFASLEPLPPGLKDRMGGRLHDEIVRQLDELASKVGADNPWVRGGRELVQMMAGPRSPWIELGFDPANSFVLYGLSIFPVFRIGVADPARLHQVIDRVTHAAGITLVPQRSADGHTYYAWPVSRYSVVAAVLDRELVLALLPTASLARTLPNVFGTALPAASLRDATLLPDVMTRHHLSAAMVGVLDVRRFVTLMSTGDAVIDFPPPIPAECRADADRFVALAPRLAYGYHHLDAKQFDAAVIVETSRAVIESLARLRRAAPALPTTGHPLLALTAAIDLDGLFALRREVAQHVHDHPFTCPVLAPLGGLAESALRDNPLPRFASGLHAVELVVDDATRDPPGGSGHLLVIGDHVAEAVNALLATIPAFGNVHPTIDGAPIALPIAWLGLHNAPTAQLAVKGDRAVVAIGPDSVARVTARLTAPTRPQSPLGALMFDGVRFSKLYADRDMQRFGDVAMALELADEAIELRVTGSWAR